MAKTVESTTSKLNDPIGILLALGAGQGVAGQCLEHKVGALAAAGFSPMRAVDVKSPLGKEASVRLKALRHSSWYASLVEREEIALASDLGRSGVAAARL
jgi:hypothetical protein